MTTYLDRSDWTSTAASGIKLAGSELVGVAVHWPGTSTAAFGTESKAKVASRLRGWRNFHVTGRGWRDIGYNVAFDQAGRVWMLRSTAWGVNMVGAHCASPSNPRANHKYAGVLLILGAKERPSPAMREAFSDWYHRRFLARWFSRTDIRGHGQVPGASTECPGSQVRADLSSGALTSGSTGGTIMSWNEDLEATDLAESRFPDSYSREAGEVVMHILGLAYQATYGHIPSNNWMKRRWPNDSTLQGDGYSNRVYQRSGYGHSRKAAEDIEDVVIPLLQDIKASQGDAPNQEVLDEIHAELEAAREDRQAIGDKLDELIDLWQLFEGGQLDSEQLLDQLGERLRGGTS